jgi:hypothetical protein
MRLFISCCVGSCMGWCKISHRKSGSICFSIRRRRVGLQIFWA